MNYIQAITLGLIQGITEWLPISSSGHLAVASNLFNYKDNLPFDTLLHIATLLVVLIYFRKDIIDIFKEKNFPLMGQIVLATIPVVIIGLLFKDYLHSAFASLTALGVLFVANGTLLQWAKTHKTTHTKVTTRDAIIIGLVQILALFPGISRSGTTIIAGYKLGLQPDRAARFSFLLAIPTIAGAFVLNISELSLLDPANTSLYIVGFIAAFISGYASLGFLMWIVKKAKLHNFAYYSWAAGFLILLLAYFS